MSKVRLQCRRGMLELDFILERFLDQQYESLSEKQKELFLKLLNEEDVTLYDWLVKDVPCTDATLQEIVKKIV